MALRTLLQLVDTVDPAWPLVQAWCRGATNQNRVLPASREAGENALVHLQVTSRSPLGAIALETGGVVVDHGWVRVLGAASDVMKEGLVEWNNLGRANEPDQTVPKALLIGHDVTGGFFGLNGGRWVDDPGGVYYWGPDTLAWTKLGTTYSGWLQWVLNGQLERFYETLRWAGWQEEIAPLSPDQGMSIYPFPWAPEGGPIASRSRRAIPLRELWEISQEMASQLSGLPPGSKVEIRVVERHEGDDPEKLK